MTYKLIYDVATMSQTPRNAALFALAIGAVVVAAVILLKLRGLNVGVVWKFLAGVSGIMLLVSVGSVYEQNSIAKEAAERGKQVQGMVAGHWKYRVRSTTGKNSYQNWEGFSVGGVPFTYSTNLDQNYFNGNGPNPLEMRNGLMVRLIYLETSDSGKIWNKITRVEVIE